MSVEARANRILRPTAGIAFDALSLTVGVAIAFALSGDARATSSHQAAVWAGIAIAAAPLTVSLARRRGSAAVDGLAILGLAAAMSGSYEIGGLALLVPAFLFAVAGTLHHLATPAGARNLRLETGRPSLIGALILAALGAFLGMSLTVLAIVGWATSLAAIWLLGRFFVARRRQRGKALAVAWIQASAIVIGLNALAWVVGLSLVAIF